MFCHRRYLFTRIILFKDFSFSEYSLESYGVAFWYQINIAEIRTYLVFSTDF